MKSFKVIILACAIAAIVAGTALAGGQPWNYYEDGQKLMNQGKWDRAIDEFKAAVSLDFKDRKNLRTYGMNFVEYFPHREMGICFYNLGDMINARRELDLSNAYIGTGRARDYLDKIGKGVAPANARCSPRKRTRR